LSMLNLYRALATLRGHEPALYCGDYASVETSHVDLFAYRRTAPDADSFLIVLNFGNAKQLIDLTPVAARATIAVDTDMQRKGLVDLANLTMNPNEGLVLRLA
jgi:hypothetical protein